MTNITVTRRQLLGSTMLGLVAPAFSASAFAASGEVYRDARAPITKRVADLLARMTLEEKAAQLSCKWGTKIEFMDDGQDDVGQDRPTTPLLGGREVGEVGPVALAGVDHRQAGGPPGG